MPTRLPPETVQQWCQDEREQIDRYAAALAQGQAARRGIEVWRGMHAKCRDRMIGMQSDDAERLREALRDGELAATQAHEAATVELSGIMSPFTALSETMSRACGT